jgi:hypothetical protein
MNLASGMSLIKLLIGGILFPLEGLFFLARNTSALGYTYRMRPKDFAVVLLAPPSSSLVSRDRQALPVAQGTRIHRSLTGQLKPA